MKANKISRLKALVILAICAVMASVTVPAQEVPQAIFDMQAIHDVSTLDVKVQADWHLVKGNYPSRQKLITINVGEVWPGQQMRIPVRFIVPEKTKAEGFHLTGAHSLREIKQESKLSAIDIELLRGGIGLVHTIVQQQGSYGDAKLGKQMSERFINSLNPRYSIQYWGWPATLMRSVTAAYAETSYFQPGKIALSGGSKNGASPSVAIIHDKRMTAIFATISPIWPSPLRLNDVTAWQQLNHYNEKYGQAKGMAAKFLGGTYGPLYNQQVLAAGHNWHALQQLAQKVAPQVFIANNFKQLKARQVAMFFQPGTHDFVAFDNVWGGKHYPQIPVYLKANTGHGKKKGHSKADNDQRNKTAFLFQHFFADAQPLLKAPKIKFYLNDNKLFVSVKMQPKDKAENGRLFWLYDRAPEGTQAYLNKPFPDKQWQDLHYEAKTQQWIGAIELDKSAVTIDFFSTHGKEISYKKHVLPSYISSPYSRVKLK